MWFCLLTNWFMDISFQHFEHFCNILVSFILVSFVTCSILREIKKYLILLWLLIGYYIISSTLGLTHDCGGGTRISRDCAKNLEVFLEANITFLTHLVLSSWPAYIVLHMRGQVSMSYRIKNDTFAIGEDLWCRIKTRDNTTHVISEIY